jgi:hypothetical protein
MPFPLALPPLLLADVGEYIGMAVLLLSFLGWIVNSIKGNQPEGQPRAPRPKPQRDLRAELEVFLEELQAGKPQPKPEPPKPQLERPRPTPAAAPVAKKKQRDKKPQPKSALKTLVQPSVQPTAVGGGVREHVAAYMQPDRVGAHAQSHIGQHRIDDAVSRDLAGGTVAAVEPVATIRATPHPLLQALSSRDGVRQAVVLQEILQRPRALRRD